MLLLDETIFIRGGLPCLAQEPKTWEEECGSSDAMALYHGEDEEGNEIYDCHCFSCEQSFRHNRMVDTWLGDELEISEVEVSNTEDKPKRSRPIKEERKPLITMSEISYLRSTTLDKHNNFRGVRDEIHNLYGIRSEYNSDGEMVTRRYPVTLDNKPASYRTRVLPKDFSQGYVGHNGKDCDLFGQSRFPNPGKYLLITGGEEDCPAGYQMLLDSQVARGRSDLAGIPVVSGTVGEGSLYKQVQTNYEYVDSAEIIVLCMDADEAGEKATKKVLEALPPGKVRVMTCPAKDPCEALKKGLGKEFVNAFYKAKQHSPAGILLSGDLLEHIIERARIPKIPLPPFLRKLEELLCGGIPLGYIVNILSASGTGKSTIINEMMIYFALFSPHLPAVVSLEAGAGEYGTNLLSRHIGRKIELISDEDEKIEFLQSDYVKGRFDELFYKDDGSHAFILMDDRGDIESIQKTVEMVIKRYGAKIIMIDPIQDILDSLSLEQQAAFLSWEKQTVQREVVTIININHSRKSSKGETANSRGGELDEEDMQGTSALFKSAGINIVLMRDKMAEDDIDKNTTVLKVTKARATGMTGYAGPLFYDNGTHTMYDKEDFFNGEVIQPDASMIKEEVVCANEAIDESVIAFDEFKEEVGEAGN